MTPRHTAVRQATAFGFAALVTLSMLAGVDRLAAPAAADMQMARPAAPTQIVVIEAARRTQS